MEITLPPKHERLIEIEMETGVYSSPEEVIGHALELLRSEHEWLTDHRQEVSDKIERAFDQFERGQYFSSEESRLDLARRKAAWLREHGA